MIHLNKEQVKAGEGLTEGLSGTLSGTLNDTLSCIKKNPGIQANQISKILKRPIDTVKKQVKHLADKGLIIRKGSRKTGGYWAANGSRH